MAQPNTQPRESPGPVGLDGGRCEAEIARDAVLRPSLAQALANLAFALSQRVGFIALRGLAGAKRSIPLHAGGERGRHLAERLDGVPAQRRLLFVAVEVRLPRQIPCARAMEQMLTGDPISAQDALAMGLVNHVVASGLVLARALGQSGQGTRLQGRLPQRQ